MDTPIFRSRTLDVAFDEVRIGDVLVANNNHVWCWRIGDEFEVTPGADGSPSIHCHSPGWTWHLLRLDADSKGRLPFHRKAITSREK